MAGNSTGATKRAAAVAGVSMDEWSDRVAAGTKWCWDCGLWLSLASFGRDSTRHDGVASQCLACRKRHYDKKRAGPDGNPRPHLPNVNPLTGRCGPEQAPARDGDRIQARQRVNHEIKHGYLPRPDSLPCSDCGRIADGAVHFDYDHYLGYDAAHHLDVQAVCRPCHAKREMARMLTCKRGHPWTAENTIVKAHGHRTCRICTRAKEAARPYRYDAEYHRAYRERRKQLRGN